MKLSDIFPTAIPPADDKKNKWTSNSVRAFVEDADLPADIEALQALKKNLEETHKLHVGKLIGVGGIALIFEITNAAGQVVPSAALRIEAKDSGFNPDSPSVIDSLPPIVSGDYEARIVPKAKPLPFESEGEKRAAREKVKKTFAILNTEGKLDRLKDLNGPIDEQFMQLDGMEHAVFVDLNGIKGPVEIQNVAAMLAKDPAAKIKTMGNIGSFVESQNAGGQPHFSLKEIESTKIDLGDLDRLRKMKEGITLRMIDDLQAAGIEKLNELAPTDQQITLKPLNEPKRTVA
jgi:hypothetical protein